MGCTLLKTTGAGNASLVRYIADRRLCEKENSADRAADGAAVPMLPLPIKTRSAAVLYSSRLYTVHCTHDYIARGGIHFCE